MRTENIGRSVLSHAEFDLRPSRENRYRLLGFLSPEFHSARASFPREKHEESSPCLPHKQNKSETRTTASVVKKKKEEKKRKRKKEEKKKKIQTHKKVNMNATNYDKTHHANFRAKPPFQATKQQLNNSQTV